MSNQIFKSSPPIHILFDLCDKICSKNNNFYIFNNNSFKKINLLKLLDNFLKAIKPYYHESKKYYVDRKITFSNFNTILRQICKINNIAYVNSLKYINGSYEITYHIYYNNEFIINENIVEELEEELEEEDHEVLIENSKNNNDL